MITVEEARDTADVRLRRNLAVWAAEAAIGVASDGEDGRGRSSPPDFHLGLRPPTQKQVLADQAAAESWARDWREAERRHRVSIDWEPRSWRAVGRQDVPVRLTVATPDDLAEFIGGQTLRDWRRLRDRAAAIRTRWPGPSHPVVPGPGGPGPSMPAPSASGAHDFAAVIRAQAKPLLGLDDEEFTTVLDVVDWLAANPLGTMRPRQLPIRGVDSKWFGRHRTLVTTLLGLTHAPAELDILDAEATVRIRICDPGMRPGGLRDLSSPVDQLAELPVSPHSVLVVENLETVLALPDLPGVVAVHGSGYAVDAVARIPWAASARMLYWGDLDSHGFAILGRLRSHVPEVRSFLMDEDTLLAHRDLWVSEPKPFTGRVAALTGSEQRALDRLRAEGNVRLEQERIPWARALEVIMEVTSS